MRLLTVNAGSSNTKLALFDAGDGAGLVAGDQEFTFSDIPAGTLCNVVEVPDSANRDGYVLESVSYDVDGAATSSFTIAGKGQTHAVTVSNSYKRLTGGFTIAKTVDGDGASSAPGSYTIDYTCTDSDGAPTVSGELML